MIEYKQDAAQASNDALVLTTDFSQNLSLPCVPDAPSRWCFLWIIAVSLFGVFSAAAKKHFTYMYSEMKGGKGANETVSTLHKAIELYGAFDSVNDGQSGGELQSPRKSLVVWADNCSGQNKTTQYVSICCISGRQAYSATRL